MRAAGGVMVVALALAVAPVQAGGVDAYLRRLDADHDGRVDQREYVRYMMRGFHAMDRNRDGHLDASELPTSSHRRMALSAHAREQEISAVFRRQDLNGDGSLDAHELAQPPQ